jgi:thiol:disulfide interchange protein
MTQLTNNLELYLQASVLMSFAAAFLGGLAASLTPCIYPMIPITAGYVGGRNIGGGRLRAFILSLFYVTGVAATYAGLGIFSALTGRLFGQVSTNPYAYLIVANVIIFLGLGMLDVFPMPHLDAKISPKRGGTVGAFLMGAASGLVAAPCTAPVLGVLLAYVASTQDVLLGAGLLLVFAYGMGILLVLVGTFSGILASLPKTGEWMVKIKKGLGLFMIGLGEYFLIKMGELLL